jgi:hypothetical protein
MEWLEKILKAVEENKQIRFSIGNDSSAFGDRNVWVATLNLMDGKGPRHFHSLFFDAVCCDVWVFLGQYIRENK